MDKIKIVPLNDVKQFSVKSVQRLESRLEMGTCGKDCCSTLFYGSCK